jgi:hypothetical protein
VALELCQPVQHRQDQPPVRRGGVRLGIVQRLEGRLGRLFADLTMPFSFDHALAVPVRRTGNPIRQNRSVHKQQSLETSGPLLRL